MFTHSNPVYTEWLQDPFKFKWITQYFVSPMYYTHHIIFMTTTYNFISVGVYARNDETRSGNIFLLKRKTQITARK